jgi:hypothetical protein
MIGHEHIRHTSGRHRQRPTEQSDVSLNIAGCLHLKHPGCFCIRYKGCSFGHPLRHRTQHRRQRTNTDVSVDVRNVSEVTTAEHGCLTGCTRCLLRHSEGGALNVCWDIPPAMIMSLKTSRNEICHVRGRVSKLVRMHVRRHVSASIPDTSPMQQRMFSEISLATWLGHSRRPG